MLYKTTQTMTSLFERDRPVIVIDSREKRPYSFDLWKLDSVRKALPAGDYSLEGYERSIAVERKSLDDLVSSVTRGRKRFQRELGRLSHYDAACVVVETDMKNILAGKFRSRAHPSSIMGSIISMQVDYGIPFLCCSNRRVACLFIKMFLLRHMKKALKNAQTI